MRRSELLMRSRRWVCYAACKVKASSTIEGRWTRFARTRRSRFSAAGPVLKQSSSRKASRVFGMRVTFNQQHLPDYVVRAAHGAYARSKRADESLTPRVRSVRGSDEQHLPCPGTGQALLQFPF